MSNDVNLFTPLVDSLVDAGKIASNHIKKILGLSTLDFRKLFEELNICNKSKEYPKLYDIANNDYFKTYQFTVPVGLSIEEAYRSNYAFYECR